MLDAHGIKKKIDKKKKTTLEKEEKYLKQLKEWIKDEEGKLLLIGVKEAHALKVIEKAKTEKKDFDKFVKGSAEELKKNEESNEKELQTIKILENTKDDLGKDIEKFKSSKETLEKSVSSLKEKISSETANLRAIKKELSINSRELKKKLTESNRAIKDLEKAKVDKEKVLNDVKKEKEALGIKKNKILKERALLNKLKKLFKFYARRMNRWYKSKGLKEPIKLFF